MIDEVKEALEKARKEADEGGSGGSSQPTQSPATAPVPAASTPQTASPSPQGAKPAQAVPLARFQEVYNALHRAREEVTYWKAVAETRREMVAQPSGQGQPSADQPVQQQDPAALEVAQHARLEAAAKQFDEGEINMTDFVKVQREVGVEIQKIREAALQKVPAPQAPQLGLADQAMLDRHLEVLYATYPWSKVLPGNELMILRSMVEAGAQATGKPIGVGPREDMRLRTEIAKLAQVYGPMWHPDLVPQVPLPTMGAPTSSMPPQSSAPAQRQIAPGGAPAVDKISMAERHPPNISGVGSGAQVQGDLTEAQIMALTPEDYVQLPAGMRQRLRTG